MNGHPEFESLDEFVLGTLDPADAVRVHDHLSTCAECRAEYAELRSVIDVLPYALPLPADLPALQNRIFAAIDLRVTSNRTITVVRALAAVLLLAIAGDAFLATRLAQSTRIAVAPPIPVPTARRTVRPQARPPQPTRQTSPPAAAPRLLVDAQRDKKVAGLERDLALARLQIRGEHGRVRELQKALALARATPRIVTVTVTPPAIPKATVAPMPSFAPSTPEPDKLVAALRTGRVYAIDGAVDGEPWHLTIIQPHDGDHARIFSGTPSAPPGDTYRTWVVRNGRTVDIGELPPGTPTTLEMPMALEAGDVVAFSREPIGTGELPTTPFLMQLKITL